MRMLIERPARAVRGVARKLGCVVLLLSVSGVSPAADAPAARSNAYLAGPEVRLTEPVNGDLMAAGGRVVVDKPVRGDASLVGGAVDVRSRIEDDLRAAGGAVTVESGVGGEMALVGGRVSVQSGAEIAGPVWVAGGNVILSGRFAGPVRIYAGKAVVGADVAGPLTIFADEIELAPGARIRGTLTYTSPNELARAPTAEVSGSITREAEKQAGQPPSPAASPTRWPGVISPLWMLGLLAAGTVLLLVFPEFVPAASSRIGASPWGSLGLGVAFLFAAPPVMVILLMTVIGIPLALAAGALYLLQALAGYLTAAYFLGVRGLGALRRPAPSTFGMHVAAIAAGLVLLWLVRLIPVVGSFVVLLAVLFGAGAWALELIKRRSQET